MTCLSHKPMVAWSVSDLWLGWLAGPAGQDPPVHCALKLHCTGRDPPPMHCRTQCKIYDCTVKHCTGRDSPPMHTARPPTSTDLAHHTTRIQSKYSLKSIILVQNILILLEIYIALAIDTTLVVSCGIHKSIV